MGFGGRRLARFTRAEIERMKAMAATHTAAQIATALGRDRGVIYGTLARIGVSARRELAAPIDDATKAKIRQLCEWGYPDREIARRINRHVSTVRYATRGLACKWYRRDSYSERRYVWAGIGFWSQIDALSVCRGVKFPGKLLRQIMDKIERIGVGKFLDDEVTHGTPK